MGKTEAWRKTHRACNICDKKAVGTYSPDLDIRGLAFCEKHRNDVFMVYVALMSGSEDLAKSMMKGWKHV